MSRMNALKLLIAGALVGAVACAEPNAPGIDVDVSVGWMEWPSVVTAGQPGSIRVVGFHGACGVFRIEVAQSGPSSVMVNAKEHFDTDTPPPCPAVALIFDTVIPLPPLVSPIGPAASFDVTALTMGSGTVRTFGVISLTDQQPVPTVQVGGIAMIYPDSMGCGLLARSELLFSAPRYLMADTLTIGGAGETAFINAYLQPVNLPRCGRTELLKLHAPPDFYLFQHQSHQPSMNHALFARYNSHSSPVAVRAMK